MSGARQATKLGQVVMARDSQQDAAEAITDTIFMVKSIQRLPGDHWRWRSDRPEQPEQMLSLVRELKTVTA